MANLFKNFLDSMKLTEDDDNEDYDDYVQEEERKERKKAEKLEQKRQEKKSFAASRSVASDDYSFSAGTTTNYSSTNTSTTNVNDIRKQKVEKPTPPVSKVVPIRNAVRGLEVCIMKPTSFEDSQDICDMLLSGRAAVINLEGFDVDIAQRVMDFVSGAVYSLNGKLHQISSYIFIISPDNVDVSGDYLDLIRQNGFEVPTLNKEF